MDKENKETVCVDSFHGHAARLQYIRIDLGLFNESMAQLSTNDEAQKVECPEKQAENVS